MAKKHAEPAAVRGVGTERLTKSAGAGHYGSDEVNSRVREPGLTGREPFQGEQTVPRSPGRPLVREWATPSYSSTTGRGHIFDEGGDRQVPKAGTHTAPNNAKGRSRPGRW